MKSKLLLWGSVIASIAVSAHAIERTADSKKEIAYWRETGMDRQFFRMTVNDKDCRRDKTYFRSCLLAIQTMGLNGKHPVVVLPTSMVGDSDFSVGKAIVTSGPITISEMVNTEPELTPKKDKLTPFAAWKDSKRILDKNRSGFETLFTDRSLNVDKVLDEVLRVASTDLREESWLLGMALNEFIITGDDAHGHLSPTNQVMDEANKADAHLTGVGMEVRQDNGKLVIVRTFAGSPARAAGIKANDELVAVDGASLSKLGLSEAVDRVKGVKGTTVQLTVVRQGRQLAPIGVVRDNIKNVSYEVIALQQVNVGYIRLGSFNDNEACSKVGGALLEEKSRADVTVLDLRDDPGGLVDQALCIASLFIGDKVVFKQVSLDQKQQQNYSAAKGTRPSTDKPLIVLINARSASASELVSGAFQDYARLKQLNAWIVGERSFGKGTMQTVMPLKVPHDLSLVKTIARFHQPLGGSNQIRGIVPDLEIPAEKGMTEEQRFSVREEQMFPNAQPVGKASESSPERVAAIKSLSACVDRDSEGLKNFLQGKDHDAAQDYQLLSAFSLAQCQQEKALRSAL